MIKKLIEPLKKRRIYYYRRRFINKVFSSLAKIFAEKAEVEGITKSDVATKLGVHPYQITQLLSAPRNLTLENISDFLLALECEVKTLDVIKLKDNMK